MKALVHTLIIVVAAGLGLVFGVAWRSKAAHASVAVAAPTFRISPGSNALASSFRSAKKSASVRTVDDSPLATQLERDLSMSAGVTRWLYWLEAIERAAISDFPRLAQLAKGDATALRLLAARWIDLSPRHLFDTIAGSMNNHDFPGNELATILFDEWIKRDPNAVVAALSETNHPTMRNWRQNVAGMLTGTDPERGLRLLSEWNVENYGPRMTGVAKWAAADPRHAAEVALANPAGYASQLTVETIGKEWARTDPARAMEFANAHPGDLGSTLANSVLKNWASRDLDAASQWLAGVDASTRNRLAPSFVESWAKQDAASALTWCDSNLTGGSLAQAVGGVVKGAAESDLIGAATLVSDMKPSPARAEAAAAVAQKWLPDGLRGKPIPPDAIEWFSKLDPGSVKRVVEQTQWQWSETDPKSLATFLLSNGGEQVTDYTFSNLARTLARQNPSDALDWASHLPDTRSLTVGGEAFTEWSRSQPEAAFKWLNDLPEKDQRREPFFQSTIQALAYDSPVAAQFALLSPAEREAALAIIAKMSLPEDRRGPLQAALKPH